jgi:hypothetical protein
MATGARERITTRSGGGQLATVFLVGAVVLVAVLVLAFLASAPARSIESSDPGQRAIEADAARWTAMGEFYAAQAQADQRARDAYEARNTALAVHYDAQAAAEQRAMDAYAARLTGQAEHYLGD